MEGGMVKGLGTVIYPAPDLGRAKAWYSKAFGQEPYFDQPFYVGFNVGGYELGLHPSEDRKAGSDGGLAYWRVDDIAASVQHFTANGATLIAAPMEVGEGIKVATVADPF